MYILILIVLTTIVLCKCTVVHLFNDNKFVYIGYDWQKKNTRVHVGKNTKSRLKIFCTFFIQESLDLGSLFLTYSTVFPANFSIKVKTQLFGISYEYFNHNDSKKMPSG